MSERTIEPPFATRGECMRQNGPSSDCEVSVVPLSPLFSRQTSDETPSEPAISTVSLWVSLVSLPISFRIAVAAWNSASVRRTSRTKPCRWRDERDHDLAQARVGGPLHDLEHGRGHVLLALEDHVGGQATAAPAAEQQLALARVARERGGALELPRASSRRPSLAEQVAAHARQQVVARERGLVGQRVDQLEAGRGPEGHRRPRPRG